jgi:hypothetical protein
VTGALAVGASGLVQSFNARETAERPWMRPDEIVLTAHEADALPAGGFLLSESTQQPLPDGLVDELQDELGESEVLRLRTAVPADAPAGDGWEATGYVPSVWSSDGSGHVALSSTGQ